jgi:predicted SAM-dependent methyltransferase
VIVLKNFVKSIAVAVFQYMGRVHVAKEYLVGEGIEIGALQSPMKVPRSVKVKYVDMFSKEDATRIWPAKKGSFLVDVDIIDDGETLKTIKDNSQDFVIANHFLEHCMDPIGAIRNMLRVIKKRGIVYLSVPDKRFIFDKDRPTTSIEHLITDYEKGPEWSEKLHYEEIARFGENIQDEEGVKKRVEELTKLDYRVHFHAWTQIELVELLIELHKRFDFEIEQFKKNEKEVIIVLRKV